MTLRLRIKKKHIKLSILLVFLMLTIATQVESLSWSDYEVRLTEYHDFDGIPSIIQASDGTLWVFWSRKLVNYDIYYETSCNEGLTWSNPASLTGNSGYNMGVSAFSASDGTLWLVWASDRTGNYDIFYKTSSNLGASWSNDIQLTSYSGNDLKPTVRQLYNGTFWVVWSSDRSGGYDLYLKTSSDNGVSWSDDFRLTSGSELDKSPSFWQMSDGNVWLFWACDGVGNYDVLYKVYDGLAWSSDKRLTNDQKVDSNPFVFQTLDGRIWVFWSSREPGEPANDDVFYEYSSDNGVSWSAKTQFTTDTYDDAWASAVQTQDTRVWVVWTSDRADQPDWGNWDIYYKTSLVGDVNGDGEVDIVDLSRVGLAFGRFKGEPGYDADADINFDEFVDIGDITLVCINYGST